MGHMTCEEKSFKNMYFKIRNLISKSFLSEKFGFNLTLLVYIACKQTILLIEVYYTYNFFKLLRWSDNEFLESEMFECVYFSSYTLIWYICHPVHCELYVLYAVSG